MKLINGVDSYWRGKRRRTRKEECNKEKSQKPRRNEGFHGRHVWRTRKFVVPRQKNVFLLHHPLTTHQIYTQFEQESEKLDVKINGKMLFLGLGMMSTKKNGSDENIHRKIKIQNHLDFKG